MAAIPDSVLDALRNAVGPKGWTSDPADLAPHLVEGRGLYRGASPLLLKPATTAEVAAILRLCSETGTKVVPQGGNTGLVGGAVPFEAGDEVIVNLARLNRIRAVDPLNDTLTAEAGCVLAAVQAAADAADRLFPLRIGSEGSCQIGGNLSTNAGGTAVLRYGNMRELVLGLEVVLPDGRVWDGLRGLRKDNTGYDLKQLFIGAEGTLGIITAAVLKLFPKPRAVEAAFAAVPSVQAAVELLAVAKALSGGQVTGFELMPRIGLDFVLRHIPNSRDPLAGRHGWYVLIELSSGQGGDSLRQMLEAVLAEGLRRELVIDAAIAASGAQAEAFWRLRDGLAEAQKPEGGSIKCDISVPVSRMAEFIVRAGAAVEKLVPGVRLVSFGHIGDGNVHFNSSQPVGADTAKFLARWPEVTGAVHAIAAELGGSISAEHGLGRLKRDEITHFKPTIEIELMRTLKRALDPRNILNPGKVV